MVSDPASGPLSSPDDEDALRRTRFSVDAASDALFWVTPDARIIDVNAAACRTLGYSRERLLQLHVWDVDMQQSPEGWPAHFAELREDGATTFQTQQRSSDGRVFPVEISANYVVHGGQEFICAFVRDITVRKKTEEVLAFLAQTSSGQEAEPFFQRLARFLARILDVHFICIDRLDADGLSASTIAIWRGDHFEANTRYALKDTPCHEVIGKPVCSFPADVLQVFPRDPVLSALKAESYVGATLWSHTAQPIGLIAAIGVKPLADVALAEATLKLVAGRAAGELERLEVEEALRASEQSYRNQFASNTAAMLLIDPADGAIRDANTAAQRFYGYSREQLLAMRISDINTLPPAEIKRLMTSATMERGTRFEFQHRLADGSVRDVEISSSRIQFGGRTVLHSIIHDITARKQAEAALAHSADLLELTGDLAKVGAWELDLRTMKHFWSLATCRIMETDPPVAPSVEEGINSYAPEARPLISAAVQAAIQSGTPYDLELPVVTAKGRPIWVRAQGSAVLEGGKVIKLHGAFHDITARKRAEEEKAALEVRLQQAEKMESVGRLAGGVAHDFNNMLSVILSNAEVALEQVDPASPLRADLEEIQEAARRSADLTRQLLAFARKQTIAPRVLDLNETIVDALKMLGRLISERIRIVRRPGEGVWSIKADPSQVHQILTNLCVNARDAISDEGTLTIETGNSTVGAAFCAAHPGASPGDYVRLAVSDDGCGIDRDQLAHIFEPFFTTKGSGDGTGLGLATVYGAVRQNHGFIEVASELGQGTTFTIYLPRHVGVAAPREGGRVTPARGHETILLVEDEPAILRTTRRILEREGYTVVAASTPGEAIHFAQSHGGEIDLVLTDVVMPEMNGRDLVKILLALHPRVRRLFMSGYTADAIAHHGVLEEGVNFLQKPFSRHDLTTRVREVLDQDVV